MISTDEIRSMLGGSANVEKKVWEDLIREVDENGDGQVNQTPRLIDLAAGVQGHDDEDHLSNLFVLHAYGPESIHCWIRCEGVAGNRGARGPATERTCH
jgi:hypothetical protein